MLLFCVIAGFASKGEFGIHRRGFLPRVGSRKMVWGVRSWFWVRTRSPRVDGETNIVPTSYIYTMLLDVRRNTRFCKSIIDANQT